MRTVPWRRRPDAARRTGVRLLAGAVLTAGSLAAAQAPRALAPEPLRAAGPGGIALQETAPAGPQIDRPPRATAPEIDRLPRPAAPEIRDAAPGRLQLEESATDRAVQRLRTEAAGAGRPAADAAWLLGLLALHGRGVPADAAQAHTWFERAQALGQPLAPAGLAWCEIEGCGAPPRPRAARQWLVPLRQVDPARALYLEWLIEQRLAPVQIGSPDLQGPPAAPPLPRRDLLLQAARAGSIHAALELGLASAAAGRLQEAEDFFRAAAPRSGAATANLATLGRQQQTGRGDTGPATTAEQLFAQARRYHRGEGVTANYTEAVRLYDMAADRGNAQARRMLELIFSRPADGGGVDPAWMRQLAQVEVSALGRVTVLPPAAISALQREPTPLYDLLPSPWRSP